MAKRVFVAYALQDERFRADLEKHLAPLRTQGAIDVWHDQMVPPGANWQATIEAELDAADVILLLLTSHFLASDELQAQQVQRALNRSASCGVRVVPVLVRPCVWQLGALSTFQPLPRNGTPVTRWNDPDEAWVDVVEGVLAALAEAPVTTRVGGAPASGRRTGIFVGREKELAAMSQALLPDEAAPCPVAVCALHGMAGVGKSYLADRFAAEHADRFPGGIVRVVLDPGEPQREPSSEALLTDIARQIGLPERPDGKRIAARLQSPRTLLHIENGDCRATASAAARVASALPGCAVIVTGRYRELGRWLGVQIDVTVLPQAQSLALLEQEIGQCIGAQDRPAFERLAAALGHLPLALSLAADYLREGYTPDAFLDLLRAEGFQIAPMNPAHPALLSDEARAIVAGAFELSLILLGRALGKDADRLLAGFFALGHAPAAGFGPSLGAAIAGLTESDFLRLATTARRHSLLDRANGERARWTIHPLLAEIARTRADGGAVLGRMTDWFVERLDPAINASGVGGGPRWFEVRDEVAALVSWLPMVPYADLFRVALVGSRFAIRHGPFGPWQRFCEKALAVLEEAHARSDVLFTLSHVAQSAGDVDHALRAAQAKLALDRGRGCLSEGARAAGRIADIRKAQGELSESLRIYREDVVPVFEELGDVRSRAITLGKIANILASRGELDEALSLYRKDALPVFEELSDVRSRAITLGKIADVLMTRGELDDALRIRREEQLPVFRELGDVRSCAFTVSKIADILAAQGEFTEALRLYREEARHVFEKLGDVRARAVASAKSADILAAMGEVDEALRIHYEEALPAFEKLGDVYSLLMGRFNIALHLLKRNAPGDRDEAGRLLRLAWDAAMAMRVKEAEEIRKTMVRHDLEDQ
jgi:tetratricopeptide (TPR) repeat protein